MTVRNLDGQCVKTRGSDLQCPCMEAYQLETKEGGAYKGGEGEFMEEW